MNMKRTVLLTSLAALLAGCTTSRVAPDPSILRVGVSPRSQPVIFRQDGQIAGIEADLARRLGEALGRETVFVELKWDELIPALEQNDIDIIMSNMSITQPRSIRINFTTPYLQSGLSGLFRRDSSDGASLVGSTILNQNKRIGYIKNTTGEIFCVQKFTRAKLSGFAKTEDAVAALKSRKIDMFVHDAPMIWWHSALNESDLIAFPEVLNVEAVAWGIAKSNTALLDQVNALLAEWEKDGTLTRVIRNWLPMAGAQP